MCVADAISRDDSTLGHKAIYLLTLHNPRAALVEIEVSVVGSTPAGSWQPRCHMHRLQEMCCRKTVLFNTNVTDLHMRSVGSGASAAAVRCSALHMPACTSQAQLGRSRLVTC
jgi:hypothetical protein